MVSMSAPADDALLEPLARRLRDPQATVFVLSGAGISAAANIPTYRGAGGMYPAGTLIPLHGRDATSRTVHTLWQRIHPIGAAVNAAEPTPAHRALAALAAEGRTVTVATQNIDGLHTKAGSATLELHGSLARARCLNPKCRATWPTPHLEPGSAPETAADVARCPDDGARLRPDVVLFDESLDRNTYNSAAKAAAVCDVVLAIGTSLQVHPAVDLVISALAAGAVGAWVDTDPACMLAEVDPLDRPALSQLIPLAGDAQQIVPALVARVTAG